MKFHKLLPDHSITAMDKRKRKQFCVDMQEKLEEDEFMKRLVFRDEETFLTNDKVNEHNVRIWGEKNHHATVEHVRNSPKVIVICVITKKQVYGPFFFERNVTGDAYLHILQNWLMDELKVSEHEDTIFQQDGAPSPWKLTVRAYINEHLRGRRIGRGAGDGDNVLLKWPPRSPNMTPFDFLGGYVNGWCMPLSFCKPVGTQAENHYRTADCCQRHAAA